jgi:Major Facilitator Superfamily
LTSEGHGDAETSPPQQAELAAAVRRDRWAGILSVLGFSFALGSSGLILPLLALTTGYDPTTVGFLTATSAISQLSFRLQLPAILARFPDRTMIVAANAMMATSFALLLLTREIPVFALAELLQGGARAMFWTATQTHVVRGPVGPVRSLALVQILSNVGSLSGPVIAGTLAARSLDIALIVACGGAAIGLGTGLLLVRLEPYAKPRRDGGPRMWQRPGVDLACWAGFSAGGWRAMMTSFVPVALTAAGQGPQIVGALMATSEAAGMTPAGALLGRPTANVRRLIEIGVILVALSLGLLPVMVASAPLAGITLIAGGVGSGLLTSLGPALASQSVSAMEQGEAMAVAGTFRAAALFVTPAAVSTALTVVALPLGMVVAAIAIGGPSLVASARRSLLGAAPPAPLPPT